MVVVVHQSPQAIVIGISALEHPRSAGNPSAPDLHLDRGLGAHVEQPSWRLIGASVGGHEHVIGPVCGIHERVTAPRPAAPAGAAQQQRGHADHPVSRPPVAALVQELV